MPTTACFPTFPILKTSRLYLRQIHEEDATDLFELRSNPDIMRFIPRPIAQTTEDAIALIRQMKDKMEKEQGINWGICLKDHSKMIGTIGYVAIAKEHHRAEVGYLLGSQHQRKGIMQEALNAVLQYGFAEMNLHSVEALVMEDNKASAALLLKTGFKQTASFEDYLFFNGRYINSLFFSIINRTVHPNQPHP